MSNALLLITQQRQRRKNSKPRPQYVHACVIRRHVQQYVCVHIAEDAGSSAGKVNWALCRVKAYSAQTKGPIKKKKKPVTGSWKAKHWATMPSSQSQISGMDDHKHWFQASPRESLVSKVVPTSEQDGWRDDILEGCELHADSRRCNLYIILAHWAVQSCCLGWFSTSREESASCQD